MRFTTTPGKRRWPRPPRSAHGTIRTRRADGMNSGNGTCRNWNTPGRRQHSPGRYGNSPQSPLRLPERRRKPRAHPPGIPRNHPRITPSGRSVPPRRSPPVLSANGSGPSLRQKTTNRQLSHISKDSQHPHCGYSQNIGLPTTGTIKNNLSKKSYGGSALHARTAPIPRRSPVFLGFFCVFTKYPYLRSAVCDVQNRGSTIALCTGDKQDALQTKVFISVTVAFSERSR